VPASSRILRDAAAALADRSPFSWEPSGRRGTSQSDLHLLERLGDIAALERTAHAPTDDGDGRRAAPADPAYVSRWIWAIVWVALAKIVLGLGRLSAASFNFESHTVGGPSGIYVAVILAFTIAAVFLFVGSDDRRGIYLGGFLVLIASSFAVRFISSGSAANSVSTAFSQLACDAFVPLLLALFVRDFPEVPFYTPMQRLTQWLVAVAALTGVTLFATNALSPIAGEGTMLGNLAAATSRSVPFGGVYWPLVVSESLVILIVALMKTQAAATAERARVRWFLGAIGLGICPLILAVILRIPASSQVRFVVYPCFIAVPFLTAYSVLARGVITARLAVRQAVRYALARRTILMMALVPTTGLLIYGYRYRDRSLAELFTQRAGALLLGSWAVSVLALLMRPRLLDALQRHYLHEQDATILLGIVTDNIRGARSVRELSEALAQAVQRTLKLESAAVLMRPSQAGAEEFVSLEDRVRQLPGTSALISVLRESRAPIDIDPRNPRSLFRFLPLDDQAWVVDGAARALIPLLSSDNRLLAVLSLGAPLNETSVFKDHDALLGAIASAAGAMLETRMLQGGPPDDGSLKTASDEGAAECPRCGRVFPPFTIACQCGGPLQAAPIPYSLAGKFRLDRRLGAGGMGVVYRGRDVDLERTVALKTLPRLSPERAAQLKVEARMMAAVTHPNLAVLYGAESWRGTPILVTEYLEGGTLTERLKRSVLTPAQVIALGVVLSDVLQRIHIAGILHRDVKPSNIGFTAHDEAKLLDFGVAHMLSEGPDGARMMASAESIVAGTPLYFSPETLRGRRADERVDLWGLAVSMYEALTGHHPFRTVSTEETLSRVLSGAFTDPREYMADCPTSIRNLFAEMLSGDIHRRPSTAAQMRVTLVALASTTY
jgi:hypothetical protein